MLKRWMPRMAAAVAGALLGLAASSPGVVIDLKNWTAWLGARVVTSAFPDLGN